MECAGHGELHRPGQLSRGVDTRPPLFWKSVSNTFYFVAVSVPLGIGTAFVQKRLVGKWAQLGPEVIREARRRYYGLISQIDYELGRFLGELRSKNLYDDTAIIFNSDHGEHLGDHGLWGKTTFLSGSADVPFIVRVPDWMPMARPSQEIDSPVLTADLYPTVLDMAGLPLPDDIDGVSLLPQIESGRNVERVVCGECGQAENATVFATDGRWKYVYYTQGGVEHFFDTAADPNNLHNLADHAALSREQQRLKQTLIDYLADLARPIVQEGSLRVTESDVDPLELHPRNPWAWRGPMRYGQGYGGGW